MCIRDRLEHGRLIWQELKDEWNGRVPEDDASGQRRKAQTSVLGLGVFCASLLLGIISVSYTHLDVYKRQVVKIKPGKAFAGAGAAK